MIQLTDAGGGTPLYQLKITLRDCRPPIWRRIVVRADVELDRLHRVIQIAMGWTNSHLHQFVLGGVYYGQPDREWDAEDTQMLNEKHYTVTDLAPKVKARFAYEYDFGDNWEHEVVLEKTLPPDADFKHPVCLGGANACPPEDCGGSSGCSEFVKAMDDPKHEEHEQMKEWVGGAWDATRFSLEEVNAGLKRIKVKAVEDLAQADLIPARDRVTGPTQTKPGFERFMLLQASGFFGAAGDNFITAFRISLPGSNLTSVRLGSGTSISG